MSNNKTFFLIAILMSALWVPTSSDASDDVSWNTDGVRALAVFANKVSINVIDRVTDGCMPNPRKVEKTAELQLRRNNFEVSDAAVKIVQIEAVGYEINNKGGDALGCVVSIRTDLVSILKGLPVQAYGGTPNDLHGLFTTEYELGDGLLVGDKGSMQSRLEKEVEEAIDELLLMKFRAKNMIKKNFSDELQRMAEQLGVLTANKSLQRTFDPPPIFAAAKTVVASDAAELRR